MWEEYARIEKGYIKGINEEWGTEEPQEGESGVLCKLVWWKRQLAYWEEDARIESGYITQITREWDVGREKQNVVPRKVVILERLFEQL